MIERIVSGGQTGVDRAALDAAIAAGVPVGGWCPRGRRAEDGGIPQRYPLAETPSADYGERTEWNVRDADGTLVLTTGAPGGGTGLTVALAAAFGKPHLVLDLGQDPDPAAALPWLEAGSIAVLNVAGPREGTAQGVYAQARTFLDRMLAALAPGKRIQDARP